MSFFAPQNPGIGGLDELTNAEEQFLTYFAGLTYNEGDVLQIVSGLPAWAAGGVGGSTWGSITGTLSSQTDLQTALDAKVDENLAIVGATKTKITYDSKGLVTAGADATTADISDSTNRRYVTDAQLTVIGNTSGINTGDQTSIVGITGTKAQFDTAVTDGNFLYVGDITQYTDELAQDAVGAMVDSTLVYVDSTPLLTRAALTGAITASQGSNTTSLGSFTKSQLNTAVSDGDVMYVGDAPTAHTHTLSNISDVTMTVANLNSLDDGVNSTLHFHNTDRDRANHTGTQTASTISDFNTAADARIAAASINALSDVVITAPSNGQVLKYNGTNWVNDTDATGGGGVSDGDKGDITVSSSGTVWQIDAATIGITELSATGTPSATTFLRGDNTWATPAGGSGISRGQALAISLNVVLV